MVLYQIGIDVQKEKVEEFRRNLNGLWFAFLKEDGCLSYKVYRDSENDNTFLLIGEFESHKAMDTHFQSRNFEVLIGAANVLGSGSKITTCDIIKKGGYGLVREMRKL